MSQLTIYYEKLATAFVRGKLHNHPIRETHPALFTTTEVTWVTQENG